MNLVRMISERQREQTLVHRQSFQHGRILSYDTGLYRVSVAGTVCNAESITGDRFLAGDRVYLTLGRGTPQILGLLGKDVNAP
jgi:hypothetical protein